MINNAPAVVVRADLNGLGVVRSLARVGVPTITVDTTRWRAAMWSRFCRGTVVNTLDGRGLVDSLLALQKKLDGRPVLILTDDSSVSTVSEYRNELRDAYRFHLPPQNMVAMLSSKARFLEFADQNGLPVPQSIIMRPDTAIEKLSSLPFPVIMMPAAGQASIPGVKDLLHPIFTLKDAEALSRLLVEFAGEIVVQELINGPDSNVCFAQFHCGHELDDLTIFSGRKIAGHPSGKGTTALCLAAPEVADNLAPLVKKFIDFAEFEGLGSLEFKWDPRHRRYAIVGLAVGRTDWHEEIASLSGVNIPLAAYRHALGMKPIHQKVIDRTVAWRESRLVAKGLPSLSPGMKVYDGYWRRNDPLPALFFYLYTGLAWTNRHIVEPSLSRTNLRYFPSALVRLYQSLVKAIFRRGKASTL